MPRNIRDANLTVTRALPNGAATVSSNGINLNHTTRGEFLADAELLLEAPAVAVGPLADGQTLIYTIEHDTDPAFGTATSLYGTVLTQTGAGGNGCAAATKRIGLPSDVKPYVRGKCVKSGAGDATGTSFVLSLVF